MNCHAPSSPHVLRGKEEISKYLREVCAREMIHRVENEVVGENRIAFDQVCDYPDGTRVLGAETLELRDGKIVCQMNVEAWDERLAYRERMREPAGERYSPWPLPVAQAEGLYLSFHELCLDESLCPVRGLVARVRPNRPTYPVACDLLPCQVHTDFVCEVLGHE